eukprot:g43993.t1
MLVQRGTHQSGDILQSGRARALRWSVFCVLGAIGIIQVADKGLPILQLSSRWQLQQRLHLGSQLAAQAVPLGALLRSAKVASEALDWLPAAASHRSLPVAMGREEGCP